MKTITATRLRKELFSALEEVECGEQIEITLNGTAVAELRPVKRSDWREKIHIVPQLLVSSEEAFSPLEDEWEPYT